MVPPLCYSRRANGLDNGCYCTVPEAVLSLASNNANNDLLQPVMVGIRSYPFL